VLLFMCTPEINNRLRRTFGVLLFMCTPEINNRLGRTSGALPADYI
jgi:hypothetical protein